MKRTFTYIIGLVFVLTNAGFAMHHGGGMKGHGKQHGDKWWQKSAIAEMISLSAEEQAKISDLWVQHQRKMIKLKGNLRLETFELEVEDDNVKADAPALQKQFENVQQARGAIDAERFNHRMALRNLLGAERFLKIRSHFPMHGKDKVKGGQGMHGCKNMGGMGCGKGMQGMGCGNGTQGMGCGKGRMHGTHGQDNNSASMKMDVERAEGKK